MFLNIRKMFVIITLSFACPAVHSMNIPELWASIERGIKDGRFSREESESFMQFLRPELDKYYLKNGFETAAYRPVFPVRDRILADAYRKGYFARCYDFYTSTNCYDHPAVDIFIEDINRDCVDDRYKRPAEVLSVSPGIVLTIVNDWERPSPQRGGNIVWVYDPVTKGVFYYAHLKTVKACTGDIVKPGDVLGTVGRTGSLASEKRSQTHLHIMYVKYEKDGSMKPKNISDLLVKSRRKGEDALVDVILD